MREGDFMYNEYSVDVSTLKKILIDKKLEKIGDLREFQALIEIL